MMSLKKASGRFFFHFRAVFLNQRTIGPENAHLKPDLGVLSHHEMTLTLNTHTPLLTSQVVCICKVSGLRLQKFPNPVISEKTIISILIFK